MNFTCVIIIFSKTYFLLLSFVVHFLFCIMRLRTLRTACHVPTDTVVSYILQAINRYKINKTQ